MEITDILKLLGLNEKEASVYLALLELGTATVYPIAIKADIKRPTTYLILDDLQRKGLVSIVPREKKVMYTAESPEKLVNDLQKKQELVKRFMPNMLALYNARKDKPQVLLFQGKEGVEKVYEKIFSSSEVLFFSTFRDAFQMFPEMPKWLNDRVKTQQTKFREILTQTEADLEYISWIKQSEFYQSRLAPKDFPEFLTDSAIFGDSVAFFSFKPQVFAVQIDSREVSQSLRVLYDLAWKAAIPYEQVVKQNKKPALS